MVQQDAGGLSYAPLILLFVLGIVLSKILAAVLGFRFTDD